MVNCLVLFSGTKSISKSINRLHPDWNVLTLDIDKKFNPSFCVDILKWDYKTELKDMNIDYIHASPVCKEFSQLKNDNRERDLDLGFSLLNKSLEIIKYLKHNNPDLIYTIENPRNSFMRNHSVLKEIYKHTTSYCKYGFKYQKITDFWTNMKDMKIKEVCNKKNPCNVKIDNKYHPVRIGYKNTDTLQLRDDEYFKILRKEQGLVGFNDTYFRYRIPDGLCDDIIKSVNNSINN